MGALLISEDFDPVGTERMYAHLFKPFYETYISLETLLHHPTKILFELFQSQGCQNFKMNKSEDDGKPHCQGELPCEKR
jgi:endoribonuclease Dicer